MSKHSPATPFLACKRDIGAAKNILFVNVATGTFSRKNVILANQYRAFGFQKEVTDEC